MHHAAHGYCQLPGNLGQCLQVHDGADIFLVDIGDFRIGEVAAEVIAPQIESIVQLLFRHKHAEGTAVIVNSFYFKCVFPLFVLFLQRDFVTRLELKFFCIRSGNVDFIAVIEIHIDVLTVFLNSIQKHFIGLVLAWQRVQGIGTECFRIII